MQVSSKDVIRSAKAQKHIRSKPRQVENSLARLIVASTGFSEIAKSFDYAISRVIKKINE